jgi:hypothetical protein
MTRNIKATIATLVVAVSLLATGIASAHVAQAAKAPTSTVVVQSAGDKDIQTSTFRPRGEPPKYHFTCKAWQFWHNIPTKNVEMGSYWAVGEKGKPYDIEITW